MKTTFYYAAYQKRPVNQLAKYVVLSSRVGDAYQRLAHQVDLLVEVARNVGKRSVWQRITDRYQYWKQWWYQELGFQQVDEWLIKQVLFPEHNQFPWASAAIGIWLYNTLLDEIKPVTWIWFVHITKAAAPHMGTAAFTLLNHTVKLWTAVRSGLVKK